MKDTQLQPADSAERRAGARTGVRKGFISHSFEGGNPERNMENFKLDCQTELF